MAFEDIWNNTRARRLALNGDEQVITRVNDASTTTGVIRIMEGVDRENPAGLKRVMHAEVRIYDDAWADLEAREKVTFAVHDGSPVQTWTVMDPPEMFCQQDIRFTASNAEDVYTAAGSSPRETPGMGV